MRVLSLYKAVLPRRSFILRFHCAVNFRGGIAEHTFLFSTTWFWLRHADRPAYSCHVLILFSFILCLLAETSPPRRPSRCRTEDRLRTIQEKTTQLRRPSPLYIPENPWAEKYLVDQRNLPPIGSPS